MVVVVFLIYLYIYIYIIRYCNNKHKFIYFLKNINISMKITYGIILYININMYNWKIIRFLRRERKKKNVSIKIIVISKCLSLYIGVAIYI